MPAAGAVQVTLAGLSCLQVEGGSWPLASALLFARMSAFISALGAGVCFGAADIDGMFIALFACEPAAFRPAQVPRPAATRITAASAASQPGRRYQRRSRGRPAGGGALAGGPGLSGPVGPDSRRCEMMVPSPSGPYPGWLAPGWLAPGWLAPGWLAP